MPMIAALALALLLLLKAPALADPVVMISIDGLRPGDVVHAEERGLKLPVLRALLARGVYAEGVKGVLPTLTYPSHTTLITGVAPSCHGIANNLTFDPLQRNESGWYWYAEDIRAPTLWEVAHRGGLKVANVHWPVSVGAAGIDFNLPQIWRTGEPDDRKLVRALSTPGLLSELERQLGPYADGQDESVEADAVRARFAAALLRSRRPDFATVYLTGLDHVQHLKGPDTPEAHAALERIDALVGEVLAAARAAAPRTEVVIVSDHGFLPIRRDVNLYAAFADAGLLTLNAGRTAVSTWRAEPWSAGGSAAVVLAKDADPNTRPQVEGLLARLAADPNSGVERWIGAKAIAAEGGSPAADYFVFFARGFEMARSAAQPLEGPAILRGMHGYDRAFAEMNSTFIAEGPGVTPRGDLGLIDMRAIAPYVAQLLGVAFPPGGACAAGGDAPALAR